MKEIKEKLHQVILKLLDMTMNETSYTDPYIVPYNRIGINYFSNGLRNSYS